MFIASPRRQPKSGIRLGDEATLILSSSEVDGRIGAFRGGCPQRLRDHNRIAKAAVNPYGKEQPGLVKNN